MKNVSSIIATITNIFCGVWLLNKGIEMYIVIFLVLSISATSYLSGHINNNNK